MTAPHRWRAPQAPGAPGTPGGQSGLDNSYVLGAGDRVLDADARNPPSLAGAGVAELLAAEMSAELRGIRDGAMAQARASGQVVTSSLVSTGVSFGSVKAFPDGTVDLTGVDGVDADLVIKPFGWKGTFATLRDFVAESLQVHFGIQSEHLIELHRRSPEGEAYGTGVDPDDPDDDGIRASSPTGP